MGDRPHFQKKSALGNSAVVLGKNVGKGIYLLKIRSGDASIFKKIIVAR